ncbi:protein PML-like isoform X2 [Sceloporus undulatus]|uniref:protein PML-like isoform X2 n=1 Tax=Sceloporus undulatus TaxID=8520 RepID=UPI001C4BF8E2|nr:protein PML-like isoform X2 [Sceloporus undulatus]
MAQEEGELPRHPLREKLEMDEKFQFLQCEGCQSKVENPKLLPCLHNLCTECLQETKHTGFCVTCQAPHSQNAELPELQDNLLFSKLQATLSIYQKIMEGNDLTCDCEKEGQLWCSDCASFLCHSCFESHQRFLKGENHEARLLGDIRAETSHKFLSKNWKQSALFCPKTGHQKKILSIYCQECQQFLCCTCAVLDFGHVGKQCDIREEIQKRQEELQAMSMELKEKKQSFEDTRTNLEEQRKEMEDVNQKTKEQICQKVEEMVQVLREKEATFLEEIEEQHKQQIQDVEMKLQDLEGVLKRLDSSVKLVEKMDLYASDQQFLEMHPFIRGSLENLQQKQPPAVDSQIEAADSVEVKKQLQALFERVTKDKEDVPSTLEMTSGQDHVVKSPAKRTYLGDETATPTPPKVIKTEWEASEGIEEPVSPASCSLLEQLGTGSESAGCGQATRSADNTEGSTISYQRRDSSSTEISDAGTLTLGGSSDDLDGLGGLSTEEQYTLRVQPPCQARQSTPTEVLPSMPPSPVLDLSLAGLYEQSPRQLDIVHKEFYACEDPCTEPPPQLAEGNDAKDFHLGHSSGWLLPRSGQNTGSSEDGSGRTTVNIMEEEEEQQGWLGESFFHLATTWQLLFHRKRNRPLLNACLAIPSLAGCNGTGGVRRDCQCDAFLQHLSHLN